MRKDRRTIKTDHGSNGLTERRVVSQIGLKLVTLTRNSTHGADNQKGDEHEDTTATQVNIHIAIINQGENVRVDKQRPSTPPLDNEETRNDTKDLNTVDNDLYNLSAKAR